MSKSKLSSRFWYCAVSTVRTRAVMPRRSRFLANGRVMRSKGGSARRISNSKGAPVRPFTSFMSRTTHPALSSSFRAVRRLFRMKPEPSETGGWYSRVKTSSGTCPRNGARTFNSPGVGKPREASSEFEK